MKFTLSWLKDHLETDASLDQIVETLTRIGLEVEGVENPAERLKGFTVARVLTAERHPQADKHGTARLRHSRRRVERHDVQRARARAGRRA